MKASYKSITCKQVEDKQLLSVNQPHCAYHRPMHRTTNGTPLERSSQVIQFSNQYNKVHQERVPTMNHDSKLTQFNPPSTFKGKSTAWATIAMIKPSQGKNHQDSHHQLRFSLTCLAIVAIMLELNDIDPILSHSTENQRLKSFCFVQTSLHANLFSIWKSTDPIHQANDLYVLTYMNPINTVYLWDLTCGVRGNFHHEKESTVHL